MSDATEHELKVPWNYPLFKHMANEHGLFLTDSELNEIIRVVEHLKSQNQNDPRP